MDVLYLRNNTMDNIDKNIIQMQSKFTQNCKSCSKLITLNEKITYLCSKCKLYFCEECAIFLNENASKVINNCPGGDKKPHDSIMVRITRNVKEYLPIGLSIEDLERKANNMDKKKSSIRIIDSKNNDSNSNKKPRLKILDD